MESNAQVDVNVVAKLIKASGEVVETFETHNSMKAAGLAGIADQILDTPALGVPTHMAVGSGTLGATALGTEVDRNALTSKTRSGSVITMIGDWAAGDGTATITEAGLFDASSNGNMWAGVSFADSPIAKTAGLSLQITWTFTLA